MPAQQSVQDMEEEILVSRLSHTDRASAGELIQTFDYDVPLDMKVLRHAQLLEHTQYIQQCERIYSSPRIRNMVDELRSNPPVEAPDDSHFWSPSKEPNMSPMQSSAGREFLVEPPNPDPFTFHDFHLTSEESLLHVVIYAMSDWKAERMRMMLREEDHVRAFLMATKTTDVILEEFMARWICIFGSKCVDFARLMAAIFLPMEAMLKRCREFKDAGRV